MRRKRSQLWVAGSLGAIAHSIGQMAAAIVISGTPGLVLYLPVMIVRGMKQQKDPYHWCNAVVLTSFIILMPVLPQEFNPTVLPLALNLLLLSVGHIAIYYWKR